MKFIARNECRSWLRPFGGFSRMSAVWVALVCALSAASVEGAPVRVRVRGVAKLTARASRDQSALGGSELVFGGTLVDDAGQPLAQQVVTIRITHETLPNDPRLLEALKMPRGCQQSGDDQLAASVRPGGANEIVATTDDEGRFCFRARIDPDRYRATVAYAPSATHSLVDGVQRELAFDLSRRNLALHFDPTPKVIGLDTPRTTIDAIALVDDDATPQVAQRLPLVLSNEKGELARTATDASGRAHFAVSSRELGPPGPGTLHLSFPGDGETARATLSQEIERHVKVAVTVPAAERGELSAAIPEDGIPLTAEVASSFGPITEGSVEARIGEVVVGAAPVEHGIARLTLTFSGQGTEALVSLRYVPASPWYEPLGPRTILVPIRGPNLLSKAPILLAGLVVLAFFLLGRVSGQRSKPEPLPSKPARDSREAKPRIDVVQPALVGQKGWTGRVVDAHEGTPVRGARVWIERGTFEGREVLASTETDADGRFSLRDVETVAGGATITAEARLHSRLSQDLPARGDILIALADRRRTLLARLVAWARRQGPPFDSQPEPTPGHVRRAASGLPAAASWAGAVERAVFGPDEIDARAEHEIHALAPADVSADTAQKAHAHTRNDR